MNHHAFLTQSFFFLGHRLTVMMTVVLLVGSTGWVVGQEPIQKSDTEQRPAAQQKVVAGKRTAVILPFKEDINPLSGALLKKKFKDAVDDGVDVIILDIHSPGGFTAVTFELMDMVLDAKDVQTVAYIEKDAISGAALLALSTDTILMNPGARIGDAGEIVMGQDGAFRYTEAKSRSVLAQKVRDTAEATGRPATLAEKMTDRAMIVYTAKNTQTGETRLISGKEHKSLEDAADWELGPPIREAGEEMFLTLNGKRAVELGLADQTVADKAELAKVLNVKTPILEVERTWVDTLALICNFRFVTYLLILIGLIGLVVELTAPGLGAGGLVSVLCFGLFFWSRFEGGTAGWLEVMLFLVGILFIAAEIFVIPGFGVAGISGLALTLAALLMASRRLVIPETDAQWSDLGSDVLMMTGAFLSFLLFVIGLTAYMGQIPGLSRLTLKAEMAPDQSGNLAVVADSAPAWQLVEVGQIGVTVSPLRPGGRIQAGDLLVDVVTEGDYVDSGEEVRVLSKQGAKITVRAVKA